MTRTHWLLLALALTQVGCAAVTNPVADGVPVNQLPPEVLPRPKADLRPVPLTLLRQKAPDRYPLDAGDVLAVVADEVIAPPEREPPVNQPDQPGQPAVIGYPVPVRPDGTISIPLVGLVPVRGLTPEEVEKKLFDIVTGKVGGREFVQAKRARVSVQLLQRRRYQILVVREDSAAGTGGNQVGGAVSHFGTGPGTNPLAGANVPGLFGGKRGLGFTLSLPAYENDVLRALNATGGLPGLDAKNEVVIVRGGKAYCDPADPAAAGRTVRIPLRVYSDQPLAIREDDVILQEGDVVSIEARDTEVFYTAGLIGSLVVPLPRDTDLNVLQAIALVQGPLVNGSFSQTAFTSSAVNTGVGNPNASLCTVLRQMPNQQQLAIRVDLNKALRDPRERVLIQPGDFIVLQERPGEALTRYLTQTFKLTSTFDVIRSPRVNSTLIGVQP